MTKKKSEIRPIMTLALDGWSWEIYLLNPGAIVPGFGGSSRGLMVGKTASLVVRERSPNCSRDSEYDVDDAEIWERIANLIRKPETKVTHAPQ